MKLYVHYLVFFTCICILFCVPSECIHDQKLLLRSLSKQFRKIYEDLKDHRINISEDKRDKIEDENDKYIIIVQDEDDHDTHYDEEIIEYEYPYYEDDNDDEKYMKILIPYPKYKPKLPQYQKSFRRHRHRMKPLSEPYRSKHHQRMKYNRHNRFGSHPSGTRFSNDITRHLTNPDFYDSKETYSSSNDWDDAKISLLILTGLFFAYLYFQTLNGDGRSLSDDLRMKILS